MSGSGNDVVNSVKKASLSLGCRAEGYFDLTDVNVWALVVDEGEGKVVFFLFVVIYFMVTRRQLYV